MTQVFQGRSFLAEKDFSRAELEYLIDFSAHLKDLKKRGVPHHYLEGKNSSFERFEKTWCSSPLLRRQKYRSSF